MNTNLTNENDSEDEQSSIQLTQQNETKEDTAISPDSSSNVIEAKNEELKKEIEQELSERVKNLEEEEKEKEEPKEKQVK